nr:MAG TPA: hypothetical protein [Caudoviricetes sp.]
MSPKEGAHFYEVFVFIVKKSFLSSPASCSENVMNRCAP